MNKMLSVWAQHQGATQRRSAFGFVTLRSVCFFIRPRVQCLCCQLKEEHLPYITHFDPCSGDAQLASLASKVVRTYPEGRNGFTWGFMKPHSVLCLIFAHRGHSYPFFELDSLRREILSPSQLLASLRGHGARFRGNTAWLAWPLAITSRAAWCSG